MPKIKRNHDASRSAVCSLCWNESGLKPSRTVSAVEADEIRKSVIANYNTEDERFPTGICGNCHKILREWIDGKVNIMLNTNTYYENVNYITFAYTNI